MKIVSGDDVAPEIGNALLLKNMPLGTMVHNIEMQPGQGAKIARSAGSSAQLTNKEDKYAILKMPSGELRNCLLYTSDAADERSSVDLGGRRISKKKKCRSRLSQY